MDWTLILGALACLAACFVAASTGAVFRPGPWYEALRKPTWNPPNWLFPIAWSLLYLMIAAAGFLVWRQDGFGLPMLAWLVQLVLNAGWSWVFFGLRKLGWATAEALAMFAAILACVLLFAPISPLAAWLMAPYLVWVGFATFLSFTIWRLNPGPQPAMGQEAARG
ncbi:TspO/MBR family protein [Falsiroseomonas selenitidurans]|uniref:Tryptophan-rich sensory protein n=1 Tax=Falsiroseomonas selenitidurans TaxID=2716335 RepID=A0ABX1E7B0_9PROT|nr:TspO/MBR family protein [Falsiroseomonas selenitidurans]NKC33104.1 tryptophan-rich sensory protein [Falsiroseomonas selenitidurans]